MNGRVLAVTSLAFAVLAGCLPGDERPAPGSVEVQVEASASTRAPFATDDGWTITIERFLAAVGDVDLQGENGRGDTPETCNDYAETRYERLFDFVVAGREKVGLVYGLGSCLIEARLQSPSDDPVIATGASEADAERMRLRGSDDYADDERASLIVLGSATRGGRTVRFDWTFRHSFELDRCRAEAAAAAGSEIASAPPLELEGGDARTLLLEIRAEELFRRVAADASGLQFDQFDEADAAGDGDGIVTVGELALVVPPDPDVPVDELPGGLDDDDEGIPTGPAETFADLVYLQLFPRVMRVAGGGACAVEIRNRRGR